MAVFYLTLPLTDGHIGSFFPRPHSLFFLPFFCFVFALTMVIRSTCFYLNFCMLLSFFFSGSISKNIIVDTDFEEGFVPYLWGIILYQFPTGLQRTSGKNRKDIFLQVLGWNCRRRLVPPGTSLRNSGPKARAVTGGKRASEEIMWISWEISMSVTRGRIVLWEQTTPKSQWLKKQTAGPCSCPSPIRLGWQSPQRPGGDRHPQSCQLWLTGQSRHMPTNPSSALKAWWHSHYHSLLPE